MLNVIIYFRKEEGDYLFEEVPEKERKERIEKQIDLALTGLPFERVKSA